MGVCLPTKIDCPKCSGTDTVNLFEQEDQTVDAFHEYFDVDAEAGKIFWKKSRGRYFGKGKRAGTLTSHGYRRVKLGDSFIYEHRIIWEMLFGKIPEGMCIDHINGITSDNRIHNLRCVTRGDNQRNMRLSEKSKTGVIGVCFTSKRIESYITYKGKRKGLYAGQDLFEAVCRRKSAELKFNFHSNHGRK